MKTLTLITALATLVPVADASDIFLNGEVKTKIRGPGVKYKDPGRLAFSVRLNSNGTFSARDDEGGLLFLGTWTGDPEKKVKLKAEGERIDEISRELSEAYMGLEADAVELRKLKLVIAVRKGKFKYVFKTVFYYGKFKYVYKEKGKGTIIEVRS